MAALFTSTTDFEDITMNIEQWTRDNLNNWFTLNSNDTNLMDWMQKHYTNYDPKDRFTPVGYCELTSTLVMCYEKKDIEYRKGFAHTSYVNLQPHLTNNIIIYVAFNDIERYLVPCINITYRQLPHKCYKCKSPAQILAQFVDCSNRLCEDYNAEVNK